MTGSRGPISKPDHLRQRRNKPSSPLVLRGDFAKTRPKAPEGLLAVTKERWRVYWGSDLASVIREAQLPMVERLFIRYDERERAYRAVRKDGRVVDGSQGQMVQHPLLKYIDSCDAEIRQLEDRLGLSPRSFAVVGSGLVGAKRSLDELNRELEADGDHCDTAREGPDPREIHVV